MQIHHYDPITGRHLGTGTADLCQVTQDAIAERATRLFQRSENERTAREHPDDPIPFPEAADPDEIPDGLTPTFIHPAHTTPVSPGPMPEGFVPFWIDGKWQGMPAEVENPHAEPQEESKEAQRERLELLVDETLKTAAQGLGFKDMADALTYCDDPTMPQWQEEALALRKWRSAFRVAAEALIADVESGAKEEPAATFDFLALLPAFEKPVWPKPTVAETPENVAKG